MGPDRKRKKVHTRSRGGCMTCKKRKLKCDEGKPTCQRCTIEGRDCEGYVMNNRSESGSEQTHLAELTPFAASTDDNIIPIDLVSNFSNGQQHQIDNDRQTSTFDSLLSNMWSDALNADSSIDWNWMNVDPIRTSREFVENAHIPTTTTHIATSQGQSSGSTSGSISSSISSSKQNGDRRGDNLQRSLEALCSTQAQLIGLTHFFNHVAQCFHIIPAETNRWRLVFGTLSLQSDIVFRLVVAAGLASVSHHSDTSYRAVGHAHMTYSLRIWHQLVQEEKEERNRGTSTSDNRSKRTLEILAVAVLVGHFEQFDSGLAHECNECLLAALDLIDAILQAQEARTGYSDVDTGVGSSFRFLTRVLLWWETFSRTMGPASGLSFGKLQNIFLHVRRWEEDVKESMIDSTQCATGWPLDLLEVVARITKVEREIKSIQCNKKHKDCRWFSKKLRFDPTACDVAEADSKQVEQLLSEARATESQIRSCRPKTIVQDSVAAAELRFILFELLQAGALVYFARVISGRLESVSKQIQAILRFLHSPAEVQTPTAEPLQRNDDERILNAEIEHTNGNAANTRHGIPEWNNSWAADGHALWPYLQATIAASIDQQAKCRRMIKMFEEIAKCGAIHVFLQLVEEIWLRGKMEKGESITSYRLDEIFKDVIEQRRWKQLLIF